MKGAKIIGALLLLLAVAGATVVAIVMLRGSAALSQTLSDGTVVTIEATTFGKSHTFTTGKPWKKWLRKRLPFTTHFLKDDGFGTAGTSTEHDALVIWISHFDPKTGKYLDPKWDHFDITDDHGCNFRTQGWGANYGQNYSVSHIAAPVFPRRQRTFVLRVHTQNSGAVEFTIANPSHETFPNWTTEELPITRADGDLVATLNNVRLRGSSGNPYVSTDFTIRSEGVPTKDWDDRTVRLIDATGNVGWNFLCTNEPAWKVSAHFYRTARAPFATEEIWALPKTRVPEDGEGITIQRTTTLNGVQLTIVAFAGAGAYRISNGVFTAASAAVAGESWSTSGGSFAGGTYTTMNISKKAPFLLLTLKGMNNDDRLLIRARDQSSTTITSRYEGSGNDLRIYKFEGPIQAQELDLEFIINKPRHAEFIVKPPIMEPVRRRD